MSSTDTQFVTDDAGQRVGVLLGLDRYRELVDAAEALDAIRAYDDAKKAADEAIPFEQAIREIEAGRKTA